MPAKKLNAINLGNTAPHDLPHKVFALVPANQKPTEIVLPGENTYALHHFATNTVTGDLFIMVTALDVEGVDDFQQHFPSATIRRGAQAGKLPGKRGDWFINSFNHLDDGVSEPENIFRKGVGMMQAATEDSTKRFRTITDRAARVAAEQHRVKQAVKMYDQGDK